MTRTAALLAWLASVATARAALAQPAPADKTLPVDVRRVEALFDEGTKHYDVGEYAKAIDAFRKAYALMPDPSFLFNLGQAYRQMRNCRDARAAYKAYLRNAPDDNRAKAEKFVADMDACIHAEEARLAALLPHPGPPRSKRYRWIGLATAGAGALALAGGGLYARSARSAAGDVEQLCADGCLAEEIRGLDQRGRTASRKATVLFVGGGTLVAAGLGVAMYSLLRYERLTLTPVASGAVVGTSVRF
ncbi:MAG: tetratricopeptide repeat protein [Deltaproteobacteria bacterium]|nr:tetratricopeptide repeat protein [Deltaproteobacteria bacterium]